MEKLPRDLLVTIALEMNLPDILRFCLTSKRINQVVCENKHFWISLLNRDYKNIDLTNVNDYRGFYIWLKQRSKLIDIIDDDVELEEIVTKPGDIGVYENRNFYYRDSEGDFRNLMPDIMMSGFVPPCDLQFPQYSPEYFKNSLFTDNFCMSEEKFDEAYDNIDDISKIGYVTGRFNEKYTVRLTYDSPFVRGNDFRNTIADKFNNDDCSVIWRDSTILIEPYNLEKLKRRFN